MQVFFLYCFNWTFPYALYLRCKKNDEWGALCALFLISGCVMCEEWWGRCAVHVLPDALYMCCVRIDEWVALCALSLMHCVCDMWRALCTTFLMHWMWDVWEALCALFLCTVCMMCEEWRVKSVVHTFYYALFVWWARSGMRALLMYCMSDDEQ